MKGIKNKLNNNHGVSILFGLLLFMVASMVSIVIISASSTSAKRSYYTSSSIQEGQALDSLALFMKKEIDGKTLSYTYTKNKDGSYTLNETSLPTLDSAFNDQIIKITTYIAKDDLISPKNVTFNVKAINMDNVKVSLAGISDNNGSFLINFLLSSDNKNMYVVFSVDSSTSEEKNKKTIKYTWEYERSSLKEVSLK